MNCRSETSLAASVSTDLMNVASPLLDSRGVQPQAVSIVTRRRGIIFILAVFAISRIAYFAAGIRFNARPVADFWQMIDPALMRTDLIRSLWYLHMQPPGYNLAVGLIVKLIPNHYAAALWAAQTAMGAAIALCLFHLICWFEVPESWSSILTSLFVISPACVLFENDATYEYPVLLVVLLSAVVLARFVATRAVKWAFAFFGCVLTLELIRNSFHLVYLLAIAAGLLWFFPTARRATLMAGFPVLLLTLGLYVKNGLLFGHFAASTWGGMAAGVTTTGQLTREEASNLIRRGIVSPLAGITPFSALSEYAPYVQRPSKTGIPVLDQDTTSSGHPNFNNLAYLSIHDQYLADAKKIWRYYPIAYGRSVLIAWYSYFLPPTDLAYFNNALPSISPWERLFNAVIFGQILADDSYDFSELDAHSFLYTGIFLLVLIPAGVAWAAAQIVVPRWRRRWTRAQLVVLGFMLFTAVYLTLVSTLLSTFDGNRYRFPLDGFFIVFTAGMAHQSRRLVSRIAPGHSGANGDQIPRRAVA